MGFTDCIIKGNLDKAKKFLQENPNYDIHAYDELAFRSCCYYRHLDIAKWLWEISNHKINIHILDDYVFRFSCQFGHLDVAKWLLNLDFDYFANWIKENEINNVIEFELQNIIDAKIIENMIQSRPQINKDTIVVI
jgi:hypothetical protein